jgi:hypothetical protein
MNSSEKKLNVAKKFWRQRAAQPLSNMPLDPTKIPESTTSEQNRAVGKFGEPTTVDTNTFEIKGVKTGTVYGQGSNLQEAQALQTQGATGGTPTVAGRPDLYAAGPTEAEKKAGIQTIQGADGQQVTPQVASLKQLEQRAAGTLPSFNKATGTRLPLGEATAEQPSLIAGQAPGYGPPPLTDFASVTREAAAAGAKAGAGTMLNAGGDFDQQLLLKKGALVNALLGERLTPEDLRWLSPDEQRIVREGDRASIEAAIGGLNTIAQGRKDMKKEAEERALRQYEIFAQSGMSPEQLPPDFLAGLDAQLGLPTGTYESMYRADYETEQLAKRDAELQAASNLYGFLQTLPVGETINIGGIEYGSLNKGQIDVMSEDDGNGNMNIISYNRDTGETNVKTLKGVSKADGWEFQVNNGVGAWFNPRTQEIKVAYDANQPSGQPISNDALLSDYPPGSKGGQCGEWVRKVTGYGGPNMSSKDAKRDLVSNYGFKTGDGIPQPGMAFIMDNVGSYGHIGIVESATALSDGSYELNIIDSNWSSNPNDETIRQRTINSKTVYGFADLGMKEKYKMGTDSPASDSLTSFFTTPTESGQPLTPSEQLAREKWEAEQTKEKRIIEEEAAASFKQLQSTVDVFETKQQTLRNLATSKGMANAVGPDKWTRVVTPFNESEVKNFVSEIQQLTSQSAMDTLVALKERGGTLGALSDTELKMLQSAATKFDNWSVENDAGNIIGYDISENVFRQELQRLYDAASKTQFALNAEKNLYGKVTASGDVLTKAEIDEMTGRAMQMRSEGLSNDQILEALNKMMGY